MKSQNIISIPMSALDYSPVRLTSWKNPMGEIRMVHDFLVPCILTPK